MEDIMPSLETLSIAEMIDLQGHPVIISTLYGGKSGKRFDGNVFAIDPISKSIILIRFEEMSDNALEILTMMGDSIESIDICADPSPNCRLFSVGLINWMNSLLGVTDFKESDPHSDENSKRRAHLVEWLRQNCITVAEKPDGSVVIFEAVRVTAPFRPSDCICHNGIVLERVKNIVAKANL
ncbi:hypothetical protein PMAYCL1PPCAC_24027 [Pristionchus mayeri]|uniref:AD domain-containing protein n=1 Tax=Pristionchus mayeri TaxID=1317129 RepID=A0AAN5I653_9BILA|nr:hypothetical protein PMAYCL1PPCAC_24027 [Pristionchus mayeri]